MSSAMSPQRQETVLPSAPPLSLPIVIPQRRPGNKERGFIAAYAPALADYGIGKDRFLQVIEDLNKAIQHNKWLIGLQLAAAGASFDPTGIAMGVGAGVQIVTGAVAHGESRWRTNSFLDRVNDQVFQPQGLICLLVEYKPISWSMYLKENPEPKHKLPPQASPDLPFLQRVKKNLRNPVTATTQGEENLPPGVADLEYAEKTLRDAQGDTAKKEHIGSKVNRYLDERAQAKYAKESKGDVLSHPDPPAFSNRYLDPNHAATNSGLVGLLSGGKLSQDPDKMQESMRSALRNQQAATKETQAAVMSQMRQQLELSGGLSPAQQQEYLEQFQDQFDAQSRQLVDSMEGTEKAMAQSQRTINRNIFYLMIVNAPSSDELMEPENQA